MAGLSSGAATCSATLDFFFGGPSPSFCSGPAVDANPLSLPVWGERGQYHCVLDLWEFRLLCGSGSRQFFDFPCPVARTCSCKRLPELNVLWQGGGDKDPALSINTILLR